MSIPPSRLGIESPPGNAKHRRIPNMPVTVTVGAAGTASFTWPGVPADEIWTGAVSVPQATPSSVLPILWSATDGGNPIGQWYNSQSSGPLQVRTQLQVTGSGITAATLVATLQGIATDVASAPPWWPAPTPAPPPIGFTTIVSGINNATAISANPQYLNAAGGLSATPVWFPVVVGTALEIAYFEADAVNQRLTPLWSTTGTGAGLIVHNADTFDVSFVAPGNVMQGMTYLNHAPYVAFLVQGVGGVPRLVVNTGLPPVVRAPSVPQGILLTASGNIGPNAVVSVPLLCPYTGPAVLSVLLQNAAGAAGTHAFWVDCNGTNYLGTSFSWAHAIVDWVSDNNTVQAAVIEPRVIHVPPLINSVVLTSQNPNTLGYTISVVPLGP